MATSYAFGPHTILSRYVFLRTQLSFAFVNLKPVLPGHILIVPYRVVPRFADLTSDEISDMFLSAQRVGHVLERAFGGTSLTFGIQDGPEAGQTVPHVHIHMMPRRAGDYANNDDIYRDLDQTRLGEALKQTAVKAKAEGREKSSAGDDVKRVVVEKRVLTTVDQEGHVGQLVEPHAVVMDNEERGPRSHEEMAREAEMLRKFFE